MKDFVEALLFEGFPEELRHSSALFFWEPGPSSRCIVSNSTLLLFVTDDIKQSIALSYSILILGNEDVEGIATSYVRVLSLCLIRKWSLLGQSYYPRFPIIIFVSA